MAGGAIQYFLVAQDKNNQDFSILSVPVGGVGENYFSRALKLEEIDLFTTCYSNQEQLIHYLYDTGKISHEEVNLYIAFQPRKNADLNFYEVLYNSNNNSDIVDLRNIAASKLGVGGDRAYFRAENILQRFYHLADQSDLFYRMLVSNMTNIYGKFLDYFKTKSRFDGMEELKKIEGGWAFRSYTLLRNIIEAKERYKSVVTMRGNAIENISDINRVHERKRLKVKKQLLEELSPDYDPNQLSLFSYLESLQQTDSVPLSDDFSVSEAIVEEKKSSPSSEKRKISFRVQDIPVYDEVPMAKKREFVMSVVSQLPREVFRVSQDDRNLDFNTDIFSVSIDDYHLMCFHRYLNKNMKTKINFLAFTNNLINEEHQKGNYYTDQSEREFWAARRSLNQYLYQHDDALIRAYAWCRLYTEYQNLDKQFLDSNHCKLGDGFQYVKSDSRGNS